MQTTIDKQRNILIKRYHTLLGRLNITNDEKLVILGAYGVESGRDLSVEQLIDLCRRLEMMLVPGLYEADRWRKRVIASIGGWLRALGKDGRNLGEIKAIAARAAGVKSFYEIPQERLRSIYYAFRKKQNDLKFAEELTAEEINLLTAQN
jgi:hypothetical protein